MTVESPPLYTAQYAGVLEEQTQRLVCRFLASNGIQQAVLAYEYNPRALMRPNFSLEILDHTLEAKVGSLNFLDKPTDLRNLSDAERSDWFKWCVIVNNVISEAFLRENGLGPRLLLSRDQLNSTIGEMAGQRRFKMLEIDGRTLNVGRKRNVCIFPDGMALLRLSDGTLTIDDFYLYRLKANDFDFSVRAIGVKSTLTRPDTASAVLCAISLLTETDPQQIKLIPEGEPVKFKVVASRVAGPGEVDLTNTENAYISNVKLMDIPSYERVAFFALKLAVGVLPSKPNPSDYFHQVRQLKSVLEVVPQL